MNKIHKNRGKHKNLENQENPEKNKNHEKPEKQGNRENPEKHENREIIIAITGASGVYYGIRLLEILNATDIKIHLVLTNAAKTVIPIETEVSIEYIESLADFVYDEKDFTAKIASGSYKTCGIVIAPCTMKTLGLIASGISDDLVSRAADVCLKEKRKVILMVRETPINEIHIENMLRASRAGAIILPASPGFYNKPKSIDDLYNFMAGRVLDLMGIENESYERWK
ncbi:MAG: UbiX family flavin prenyltransferase [Methanosarcinaceae archaeon]|nr:UbiX family flavin prenyltransferase [Methanosarcinaceae archaeon]